MSWPPIDSLRSPCHLQISDLKWLLFPIIVIVSGPPPMFHDVALWVGCCFFCLILANSEHGRDDHLVVKDTITGPGHLTHTTPGSASWRMGSISDTSICSRSLSTQSSGSGGSILVPDTYLKLKNKMFSRDCSLDHFIFRMHKKCLSHWFEINAIDLLITEPEWFKERETVQLNPFRINNNGDSSIRPSIIKQNVPSNCY